MILIKAIKINVEKRIVEDVLLTGDDTLEAIYQKIKCDCIEVGERLENGDVLWVDEEGLFNESRSRGGFTLLGNVFVGNGLICGVDQEGDGETIDVITFKEQLRVEFLNPDELPDPDTL